MAKRDEGKKPAKSEEVNETQTEGAVAEGTEGEVSKGRAVMITNVKDGTSIARKDFIKQQYEAGVSRSDIRKALKETYNHDVAYQIIFAATKNLKKPAAAEIKAA